MKARGSAKPGKKRTEPAKSPYSGGAKCGKCGVRWTRVVRVMPWGENMRERYHRCERCGHTFTTIEST